MKLVVGDENYSGRRRRPGADQESGSSFSSFSSSPPFFFLLSSPEAHTLIPMCSAGRPFTPLAFSLAYAALRLSLPCFSLPISRFPSLLHSLTVSFAFVALIDVCARLTL